jgi:hypothetical protein
VMTSATARNWQDSRQETAAAVAPALPSRLTLKILATGPEEGLCGTPMFDSIRSYTEIGMSIRGRPVARSRPILIGLLAVALTPGGPAAAPGH